MGRQPVHGGRYTRFEVLSDLETPEQAVLVHIEQIESRGDDERLASRERRVSHVARREQDGWRIAHQHSDPLVEVVVRR